MNAGAGGAGPPIARSRLGGVALCGTVGMAAACLVAAVARPLLDLGPIATELAALGGFGVGALVAAVGALTAGAVGARPRSALARLGTTGGVAVAAGIATAVIASVVSVRAIAQSFFGGSVGGAYGEAAGAVLFFIVFAVLAVMASIAGGVFVALVLVGTGALHLAMDRAAGRIGVGTATQAFAAGALGVLLIVEGTATALGSPTAPASTLIAAALLVVAAVRARDPARPWALALAVPGAAVAFAAAMVAWGGFEEHHRLALRAMPSCGAIPAVSGVACTGYSHTWVDGGRRVEAQTFVVPDGSRPPEEVARLVAAAVPRRCVDRPEAFAPIEHEPLPVVVASPLDLRLVAHVVREPDATVDDARLVALGRDAVREVAANAVSRESACTNESIDVADGFDTPFLDCGARSRCKVEVETPGCAPKACVVGTQARRYVRRLDVDVDVVRPTTDGGAPLDGGADARGR